jgi:hypothetical protein
MCYASDDSAVGHTPKTILSKNPKERKQKFFLQKIFVFSLKRPARRSFQREKEIFFAKNFFFSLFAVSIGISS